MKITRLIAIFTLVLPAAAQDAPPSLLVNEIDQVTVYADSARVHRTAQEVRGDGYYSFKGLTRALDPDSVRVRLEGGHVLGVQVKERVQSVVPEERVQGLRDRLKELEREVLIGVDEHGLLVELRQHLEGRLAAGPPEKKGGVVFPSTEAWQASHDYYGSRLSETMRAQRELRWRSEETQLELENVRRELGRFDSAGQVRAWEVIVEVDLVAESAALELEYFVGGCGWRPEYDLRTTGNARSVELIYRARVQQETGEDWKDVELALSTARPRRGAQGPEPVTRWVDLVGRQGLARRGLVEQTRDGRAEYEKQGLGSAYGYETATTLAFQPFAGAQAEGMSVKFVMPQRETLESRPEETVVLIGENRLAVKPELYCAPELDETVWLRGRAVNDGEWVLLPGRAAVFFGDDFIGHASLDAVQPGEELELHLGSVPGVTAERVMVSEEHDEPGFLSSTAKEITKWRVRLAHRASPVVEGDGSVVVVVREAIPRSRDDRIEVEVDEMSHRLSNRAEWEKERGDLGIWTWEVKVPRGKEVDLRWEVVIAHPDSKGVVVD